MNLYFRLFLLLVKLYLKKEPIDALGTITTKLRILPNDLDLNMHMNNGRYLTVMDLARIEFIVRTGLLKVARQKKWMPIAGGVSIEYLRPLNLWQQYTITTQCVSWDDKWFYLTQKFEYDGKVMARALVKVLFRGRKASILPAEILKLLGHENTPIPEIPEEFKHLVQTR